MVLRMNQTNHIHRQRVLDALRNVGQPGHWLDHSIIEHQLRKLREELNREERFSQTELALRSGLSRQRVNELVNGRAQSVGLHEMVALCDGLGVARAGLWSRNAIEESPSFSSLIDVVRRALADRPAKPPSPFTEAQVIDLMVLYREAARLYKLGAPWRLEYHLERFLPALWSAAATAPASHVQLNLVNQRVSELCLAIVEREVRQLATLRQDLIARPAPSSGDSGADPDAQQWD